MKTFTCVVKIFVPGYPSGKFITYHNVRHIINFMKFLNNKFKYPSNGWLYFNVYETGKEHLPSISYFTNADSNNFFK